MPDRESDRRLLHHARREALVVIIVFVLALLWVVGYCYLRGYTHTPDSWVVQHGLATPRTPESFQQILGFPDWVFYGIVVPWLVCTVTTLFFCLFGMADDDLGGESQEGGPDGH